jgi:signal transduction histidine kinase
VDAAAPDPVTDRDVLRQIVGNLLSNAVKFTPEGGKIAVHARGCNGRSLEITVRDTGIGIAPGDHGRIFEEFTHVDTREARPGWGAGLGLAIVKRLVEAQSGSIKVESDVGKGSLFRVRLPREAKLDAGGPHPGGTGR